MGAANDHASIRDASETRRSDSRPGPRRVVGVMTGTSIDGMDVALVSIEGRGLALDATLVRHRAFPLGDLVEPLRRLASQEPASAGAVAALAHRLGIRHAEAIADTLAGDAPPDLVVAHGQTVFHRPPVSWQLLDPAPIAQRLGCAVVHDLRAADLAAGGQGAPITPLADWILFRDDAERRAIVNLGGFVNATLVPAGRDAATIADIRGFDVCACNQVLDAIARSLLDAPFDRDGAAARRGRVDEMLAMQLAVRLETQRRAGRSLGSGDEAADWVATVTAAVQGGACTPDDAAATAVDGVARCVAAALAEHRPDAVVVAGGGARNAALVAAIERHGQRPVRRSDELGVPIEAREAMAMAVLGALAADGVDVTLSAVTGRGPMGAVAGRWVRARGG